MKKWISITAGVLHVLFAGLLIAWIAGDWDVPDKKWAMIPSAVLLAVSVFVATALLKLDLHKLLLKFELSDASKCDRIVLLAFSIIALVIVGFEMLMIAIYFFRGVKMESAEFMRFTVFPTLALAHLAMGTGCYLVYQYFVVFDTRD